MKKRIREKDEKGKRVHVRLAEALLRQIDEKADEEGVTRSLIIRESITRGLEAPVQTGGEV